MKKIITLLSILWSSQTTILAQSFFQKLAPPPPAAQIMGNIDKVEEGSVEFADINNDGDLDVLVSGWNGTNSITKLYTNNGKGYYTIVENTPMDTLSYASNAFADIDGDGDQDLLITGWNGTNRVSKLFENDGTGSFTVVSETPFNGVSVGKVVFVDIDGDNDLDVLIAGYDGISDTTSLYINNGTGGFTVSNTTQLPGVEYGDIAFADIDGDNDQDLMITGWNKSIRVANLYKNDGKGVFYLVNNTPFEGVNYSSVKFSDIDGDKDLDLLITGKSDITRTAKLYINGGSGNFTESMGTPFIGVSAGDITAGDVDGDDDIDFVISGYSNSDAAITKLYINTSGTFDTSKVNDFFGVYYCSIQLADMDNDGDQDLIISGDRASRFTYYKSILYSNDGTGKFSEVGNESSLAGISNGDVAFNDIDNDGDLDIITVGFEYNSSLDFGGNSKIYKNDGSGTYSLFDETSIMKLYDGSIALADIDGDNDDDLLVTGRNGSTINTKLYLNNGAGNFTLVTGTPFVDVYNSSIAFEDIDSDGDFDLMITGSRDTSFIDGMPISKLYKNDGAGNFTVVPETPFDDINFGAIAFSDVDSDGDQDLFISGFNGEQRISKMYLNNGSGTFSLQSNTTIAEVANGAVAFIDLDGDEDEDLITTGIKNNGTTQTSLYINNGTGTFSIATSGIDSSLRGDALSHSDVDKDGDQDILISGGNFIRPALYINDGTAHFSLVDGSSTSTHYLGSQAFDQAESTASSFGDIDQDGDQDVIIIGLGNGFIAKTNIYRNISKGTSGIKNSTILQTIRLYPNPSQGSLTIKGLPTGALIKITNTLGQEILYTRATGETYKLHIFDKGLFYVTLYQEDGTIIGQPKVILQ
ncbi:MAG: hypothetical protein COA58_10815 [Bacteroidetes bacterium]|nr:MAG: hypothetical protein COA58_10815 [Bacteroidota bacterium]